MYLLLTTLAVKPTPYDFLPSYFKSPPLNYIFLLPTHLYIIPYLLLSIVAFYFLINLCMLAIKIYFLKEDIKEPYTLLEVRFPFQAHQSPLSTEQLFVSLHKTLSQTTWLEKRRHKKQRISVELVATKKEGIRYLLYVPKKDVYGINNTLLSYLPGVKIEEITDYMPSVLTNDTDIHWSLMEFKQQTHYGYSLQSQNVLAQHDPIAYIAGTMTKLQEDEIMSLQFVLSAIDSNSNASIMHEAKTILTNIRSNKPIESLLKRTSLFQKFQYMVVDLMLIILSNLAFVGNWFIDFIFSIDKKSPHGFVRESYQTKQQPIFEKTPTQVALYAEVKNKLEQKLFETSMRYFIGIKNDEEFINRSKGISSSFSTFDTTYQNLSIKRSIYSAIPLTKKYLFRLRHVFYKDRILSLANTTIFSISEMASLYHFPYVTIETEDVTKIHSKELPAPLSLKNGRKFSVVFGNNTYGNNITPIALTEEERETPIFIIGRTRSGKTTLMGTMAIHDIQTGQGLVFIDPHGDIAEELLAAIPKERINDLVFFNPVDLKHPIGINLLEITPGLDEDEAALEKERVCESVISLFRKVFSVDEQSNAHRIEYMLRNTIYTAFTVKDATIFTLYDILNNPDFQKEVTDKLEDEYLQNFWKYEFGKAGEYQVVKMVSGVTAKIGRFLFSPTAKRILEQKHSTINFRHIMDQGKILICKLPQGKLGEDTARLLGTAILTKIQQAALDREDVPLATRTPFYLYVDEFQNFATQSFTKLLSEAGKYGLRITIAEQSTSQQKDRSIVNIILANAGVVICFRSANPIDEELMLAQFDPYVQKGEIMNLPRYRFYIKIASIEPEEPFSGETIKINVTNDEEKRKQFIEASQKNNAIVYVKPEPKPKETKVEAKPKPRFKRRKRKATKQIVYLAKKE